MEKHMKRLIALTAMTVSMALSNQALAHGAKPKHGGVVQSAADLSFELVTKDGKAVLHIDDHGQPLATAGATGSMTILAGSKKSVVALQPAGANTLVSTTDVKFERGNKAVASITLPGKEAISLRFSRK
jgi:methionine-rich copper-binding protein CopC